jgi:hypothetical protein
VATKKYGGRGVDTNKLYLGLDETLKIIKTVDNES